MRVTRLCIRPDALSLGLPANGDLPHRAIYQFDSVGIHHAQHHTNRDADCHPADSHADVYSYSRAGYPVGRDPDHLARPNV